MHTQIWPNKFVLTISDMRSSISGLGKNEPSTTAALFIRISTGPIWSLRDVCIFIICSLSVIFTLNPIAWPPSFRILSTVSLLLTSSLSTQTILAPSLWNCNASSRPFPRAVPVIYGIRILLWMFIIFVKTKSHSCIEIDTFYNRFTNIERKVQSLINVRQHPSLFVKIYQIEYDL